MLVLAESAPLCGGPQLTPGKQITRDVPNWSDGPGTLGCIVQSGGSVFILTNQHVIVPPAGGAPSTDVYQPQRSKCLDLDCNSPVATVVDTPAPVNGIQTVDGKDFTVDCGLLKINDKVTYANTIDGIGAIDTAIRDLAAEPTKAGPSAVLPATPINVRKRGMKTGITAGTLVEFAHQDTSVSPARTVWELVIAPTTGYKYDETYTISSSELLDIDSIVDSYKGESVTATIVDRPKRKIRFQGTVSSLSGDSGSLWVDDARHACGLHFAGAGLFLSVEGDKGTVFVPSGKARACFIRPVLLAMKLDPTKAIAVASSPSSGPVIVVPGDEVTATVSEAWYVADLEARLLRSEAGQRLARTFREHHREVLQLLNRRRRVTSVWHRGKGPAFVATLLKMFRTGDVYIPKSVAGYRLEDLVRDMLDALEHDGSDRMRADVAHERDFLLRVVRECDTIDDLSQLKLTEDLACLSKS